MDQFVKQQIVELGAVLETVAKDLQNIDTLTLEKAVEYRNSFTNAAAIFSAVHDLMRYEAQKDMD